MAKLAEKELTDEALVDKVLSESTDLYRQIVERYQQKFFRYILKYIYDEDKAADIVQESFIKIYINLNGFDRKRKFSAWAYRIVHNETISFIRKNKHEIDIDDETWLPDLADDRPSLAEELDKKLTKQKLHKAMSTLPLKHREVLILYYFQGNEYREIAEILALPVSTVSTRINRAKNRLKKILIKEHGNA